MGFWEVGGCWVGMGGVVGVVGEGSDCYGVGCGQDGFGVEKVSCGEWGMGGDVVEERGEGGGGGGKGGR